MRQLNLSQAKLLSDIAVPVQVFLGELALTAAQLIDLRSGEYFPLHLDKESPVMIAVAGEVIAKGKLIKDKDTVCVLITEVFSASQETLSPEYPIVEETNNLESQI